MFPLLLDCLLFLIRKNDCYFLCFEDLNIFQDSFGYNLKTRTPLLILSFIKLVFKYGKNMIVKIFLFNHY